MSMCPDRRLGGRDFRGLREFQTQALSGMAEIVETHENRRRP